MAPFAGNPGRLDGRVRVRRADGSTVWPGPARSRGGGGSIEAEPEARGSAARSRSAAGWLHDGGGVSWTQRGQPLERRGRPPVRKPTGFVATRSRSGRWHWKPAGELRLNAPDRTDKLSGQLVHRWAENHGANRVVVIVVPHPGEPDDGASRTGLGTRGKGRGRTVADQSDVRPAMRPAGQRHREPRTGRDARSAVPLQAPVAEERATGQGQKGDGAGVGRGAGESTRGTGTSANGSARGTSLGSESPSWVDNPKAEIALRGGRTPADGGRAHGSAGGKQGGEGNVRGAGWLNVLDVPESVAPAVAAAMLVFEADVMGFGQKLFTRTVYGLARKNIYTAIGEQATAVVRRRATLARARMAKGRPEVPPGEHLDEIMSYMPAEVERGFYRELARLAGTRLHIYNATRKRFQGARDKASRWANKLAAENQAAWRKIERASVQRMRAVDGATGRQPARVTNSASAARARTVRPGSGTARAAPGASVRAPTALSTPGHTISRGGGLGPVLKGLRGEARVRAVHNIGPRKMIEIHGRKRVPDGVTDTVLTEVKNVKKLSFTSQLRDYLDISREQGLRFDLFVRRDTKLSEPLLQAIEQRIINRRFIP